MAEEKVTPKTKYVYFCNALPHSAKLTASLSVPMAPPRPTSPLRSLLRLRHMLTVGSFPPVRACIFDMDLIVIES